MENRPVRVSEEGPAVLIVLSVSGGRYVNRNRFFGDTLGTPGTGFWTAIGTGADKLGQGWHEAPVVLWAAESAICAPFGCSSMDSLSAGQVWTSSRDSLLIGTPGPDTDKGTSFQSYHSENQQLRRSQRPFLADCRLGHLDSQADTTEAGGTGKGTRRDTHSGRSRPKA
jgi:hypothetical protein